MGSNATLAACIAEFAAQQAALLAEVRGLRADLRRQLAERAVGEGLVDALREYFGPAPFTSGGILMAAENDSALADAVAAVIDMNAEPMSRAVQLGLVLKRLPGIELCGAHRGARLYRVDR